MHPSRVLKLLVVSILWLCLSQSCTTGGRSASSSKSPFVQIDADFTSRSLNEQVLICTALSPKDLTRKDLSAWIGKNAVVVNTKKEAILLGNFRKYPQAWFYTQIINTGGKSRQLVADEFNRFRCDDFEVFTAKDGAVKTWGRVGRTTPFSSYPLPFFTFAVPFTIEAKDTLHLLIHTQRHYGAHEVNLRISTYEAYLSEHIVHFLSKVFEIIVFVICALVMFIVGWIFNYKTMTYLGLDLLSVVYVKLNYLGFTDAITNFTEIGLSGRNANVFALFIAYSAVHPFLMEWMKAVPKNEKAFGLITYTMIGVNLLCACCFLLPVRLFNTVYAFIDFSLLMLIFGLITVLWMLYCSFLALLRAKVYYMFIALIIIFCPWLLQQLIHVFWGTSPLMTQIDPLTFISTPFGLAVISVYLLRKQLISRKKYEENLLQVSQSMEAIRKTEIEAIGRNLHDNVGNILASVLGYLRLRKPDVIVSQDLVKEAINEVRFLSHNLVKDEEAALVSKLESLVSRFNDFSDIVFVFKDYSEGKIGQSDPMTQQNIYMIVQEVLTNIVKHSKATEASVQVFEREDGALRLMIEDDGIGITDFTENTGIGLKNIHKRATLSQLKLTIDSTPEGTNFIIETPKAP